ncbi:hypothetical protein RRG08_004677 [Elysia crispata]|uniref:Uncharacterized protein n=1 Tax=Elysia crispata TaxID=231223 RepID=A0AAE1AAV3_9GAST|nr:hypothetical protein RRG08_004677 [Elysia crispata]
MPVCHLEDVTSRATIMPDFRGGSGENDLFTTQDFDLIARVEFGQNSSWLGLYLGLNVASRCIDLIILSVCGCGAALLASWLAGRVVMK